MRFRCRALVEQGKGLVGLVHVNVSLGGRLRPPPTRVRQPPAGSKMTFCVALAAAERQDQSEPAINHWPHVLCTEATGQSGDATEFQLRLEQPALVNRLPHPQ